MDMGRGHEHKLFYHLSRGQGSQIISGEIGKVIKNIVSHMKTYLVSPLDNKLLLPKHRL